MAQCEGIGPRIDPPPYVRPTPVFLDDLEVTENGEYTPEDGHAYGTVNVSVSGGGGGGNIVTGTFTTGSTRSGTGSVNLNYSGSGYPIMAAVFIKGGANNGTSGGDATWYSSTNRYDVGAYYMSKAEMNTTPTYIPASGTQNDGVVSIIYKGSTTNPSSYDGDYNTHSSAYTISAASKGVGCCRLYNNATLTYYVGGLTSSTIGLAPETEYSYIVVYSS